MKYTFIVMVFGYWARGQTLPKAAEEVRSMGGTTSDKAFAAIVIGDEAAEVTGLGSIAHTSESEVVQLGYGFKLGDLLKLKTN